MMAAMKQGGKQIERNRRNDSPLLCAYTGGIEDGGIDLYTSVL